MLYVGSVRNGTEEIASFDQWSVSCRALYLAFISARRPRLPLHMYRVEQKNPAKFSDTCSVRADGLCIGCLCQWAERGREYSNMQEFFCTTLYMADWFSLLSFSIHLSSAWRVKMQMILEWKWESHAVSHVISNYATPVVHKLDPCFRSIMQRMAKLILRKWLRNLTCYGMLWW